MKKKILFFVLCYSFLSYSQESIESIIEISNDSIVYQKTTDYIKEREFKSDLKDKYSDNEFIYKEEKEEVKKEVKPLDFTFFKAFIAFMQSVFPFLLAAIVVFIILKLYLGSGAGFWNFKRVHKKVAEKLVYEDEDIHDVDLNSLLKRALEAKDSRLAIRYYYLLLLKKLSEKELIKYDKDKTNSEYLFEIKKEEIRKGFSYLSYIYTYVWYGEFLLTEMDFKRVEEKYKSFFKTIN